MKNLHLRAKFGQSCAVKYTFGVNITLLKHCYVQIERLLYSTIALMSHLCLII